MQADARGPRDYEDHLYVNTQGLDGPESLQPEDSPKKDLFDMRKWGQAGLWGGATSSSNLWSGGGWAVCYASLGTPSSVRPYGLLRVTQIPLHGVPSLTGGASSYPGRM